jgi:hypothetical protein
MIKICERELNSQRKEHGSQYAEVHHMPYSVYSAAKSLQVSNTVQPLKWPLTGLVKFENKIF